MATKVQGKAQGTLRRPSLSEGGRHKKKDQGTRTEQAKKSIS